LNLIRIGIEKYRIGGKALRYTSEHTGASENCGGGFGSGTPCLFHRQAAVYKGADFFKIMAMKGCGKIGTKADAHPRLFCPANGLGMRFGGSCGPGAQGPVQDKTPLRICGNTVDGNGGHQGYFCSRKSKALFPAQINAVFNRVRAGFNSPVYGRPSPGMNHHAPLRPAGAA
jgi:hypothetical protein